MMCPPCAKLYDRWLVSKPPPRQIQLVSVGVNSARAVMESRRLRSDDHYRLVRSQLDRITTNCKRNHQEGTS